MKRFIIVLLSQAAVFPASAQSEVSPDQVFVTVGRCTVEVEYLRKALAEARAKIAELSKPPEAVK